MILDAVVERNGAGIAVAEPVAAPKRLRWPAVVAVAVASALTFSVAGPAAAQRPEEVRDAAGPTGVWSVDPTVDVDSLLADVARAREAGVDLLVVVATDPQPDAEGFALRVRQLGVADPVLVFAPDGSIGVSSERVDRTAVNRARDAAEEQASVEAATTAFTTALLSEPDEGVPQLVDDVVSVVILAVLVLGGVVVAEQALRYRRRRRQTPAGG